MTNDSTTENTDDEPDYEDFVPDWQTRKLDE